ncbi:MAG: heavy-metal-associated domain-containing protein [Armatimonadota bacterium]
MTSVTYKAPEISCEGCANAIKRALGTLQGVSSVNVDVSSKLVTVDYKEDEIRPEEIKQRIEDAGYDTETVEG